MRKVKQVILMRKDLHMRLGKQKAQAAHAAMLWILGRLKDAEGKLLQSPKMEYSEPEREWLEGKFTKISLQVSDEAELMRLHQEAIGAGLKSHTVTDSGDTEFHGVPTMTCCAIGPDYADKIDMITGGLKID